MLEEGMAPEQDIDWTSGSRKAQESFSKQLTANAKKLGIFFSKEHCSELGEKILIRSGESQIYENASQGLIYKVRDPFAKLHLKSPNLRYILHEHIVHNLLFPDTRYHLVGVTEENGLVRLIYSQEIVFKTMPPTQEQINEHLKQLGLLPEHTYYYGNEFVAVTDVNESSDNVIYDNDNQKLLFIDPIIKIKKNPEDYYKQFK